MRTGVQCIKWSIKVNKLSIICLISGLALGAAITRYYWPKIEQQTVVQEKVVTRADVRTVTRTIEVPGKREVITEIIDNSTVVADKRLKSTTYKQSDWILGAGAGVKSLNGDINYNLSINKRIIGPVFAGIYGRTDRELGLQLMLEF